MTRAPDLSCTNKYGMRLIRIEVKNEKEKGQ